jgi:hypothetical protein
MLFDSMVGSVLSYASEIWDFHRAHDIEVIHNRFCRFVLKIGKNVPTAFLYGELGHLPMYKEMIIYRPPAISKNNYFGFVNVNFNIPFLAIYE